MGKYQRRKKRIAAFFAGLLAASAVLGGMGAQTALARGASSPGGIEAQAAALSGGGEEQRPFKHPGLLHTEESFAKMRENVENGVQPNLDTWNLLNSDGFSDPNWQGRPLERVDRGGDLKNVAQFYIDIERAYQNALIWKIGGDEAHGEAACRILNGWSHTMKSLTGNADRFLAAGIHGYTLSNAAEIMREHPDFDKEAMETLLLDVFYPMNDDFLKHHNSAHIGNYWANWDLCNIASMISIGVFCDRRDIYQQAVDYYKNGLGNGSLYNAMPFVYDEGLAQWQESGRDQGHTTFGISLLGAICETAWSQGDDLYRLSDSRFLKAAEYVARYNSLQEDVPYMPYEWLKGQTGSSEWQTGISEAARGSWRPVYSLVYDHYVNRMGYKAPNMEAMMAASGDGYIEGGQRNGDELGWQTLTFANIGSREAAREVLGEFPDGIYRICTVREEKSLVAGEDGNLTLAAKGEEESEQWLLENAGDGEYYVTNVSTGKSMQIGDADVVEGGAGGMYDYGTQIGTGEFVGSLAQKFAFLPDADTGNCRIIPTANYLVLDILDGRIVDGAPILQWRDHASDWQRWKLEKISEGETENPGDPGGTGSSGNQSGAGSSGSQGGAGNSGDPEGSQGGAGNSGDPEGSQGGAGSQPSVPARVPYVKAAQQKTSRYVKVTFGKAAGAKSYGIYRSAKAGSGYRKIGTAKASGYLDKKVSAGKTYYYKVRAQGASGSGALSKGYARIRVLARPSVKARKNSAGKTVVSWKKAAGASGYAIYASARKTKGYRLVKTVKSAGAGKAALGVFGKKKAQYVKVRAYAKEKGKKVYGPYSKAVRVR